MTQRYEVRKRPFGHVGDPNALEHWAVFDLAPEPEIYYTVTGHPMMESKAPSWRIVATCSKESHATLISTALNSYDRVNDSVAPEDEE